MNNGQILLTGAQGQTGHEITAFAKKHSIPIISLARTDLDITDLSAVSEIVSKKKPSLIVNAAAYTAVDRAESDQETAFRVNRNGPYNLAQCCKKANIPLFHISTDYVFDGDSPDAYTETDQTNPCGVYGKSKSEGEKAVRNSIEMHLILRVSWVFGFYGHNFVHTILRLGREREELKVVSDQTGCPTFAGHIAQVILDLSEKILAGHSINWGTYHYCDAPATNWYDFARTIFRKAYEKDLLKKHVKITPIPSSEYRTPVKRPFNSVMECSKIKKTFKMEQHRWEEGLDIFFETMKRRSA